MEKCVLKSAKLRQLLEELKPRRNQSLPESTEERAADLEKRILKKVKKTDTCWLWKGAKSHNGYGHTKIATKSIRAHVMFWMIKNNSDVPDGMCVCHSCDNPACVNPAHLWIGTQKQNMMDASKKGRLGKEANK
jgi:hypothetical protein